MISFREWPESAASLSMRAIRSRGARTLKTWLPSSPRFFNFETVVLLRYQNAKRYIKVKYEPNDGYMNEIPGKASYGEIKAYVQEKFGMKVSNLYIAQVKRKCRIIERENYNKPKFENASQPQCLPEKDKAIRAALEHFRLV